MWSVPRHPIALTLLAVLLHVAGSFPAGEAAAMARGPAQAAASDVLGLLLPDSADERDARVQAWLDGAAELGLHLVPLRAARLSNRDSPASGFRGIVLPDQVFQRADDALIHSLERYVAAGGHLMLVYDAGSLTPSGSYSIPKSRLSALAGVDYVLYESLRERTITVGPILASERTWWRLEVPPGKTLPFVDGAPLWPAPELFGGEGWPWPSPSPSPSHSAAAASYVPSDSPRVLSGYGYGALSYPSFVTGGAYRGTPLLTSAQAGVVAGVHYYGDGQVLFVNLPLGYLKGRTDGLLLHAFLQYFARSLALPYLAPEPRGRGGIVLNWHVDSNAALGPLKQLETMHVWDQGPFSVHLTAGPDTFVPGDGLGLDVPNNSTTRAWIKTLRDRGHAIGSHGGWIHNYYAGHANETNRAEYEPYLELNKQALEAVSGQPVIEYSAPSGTNPTWAIQWLSDNGFVAYYTVGHTGMGPLRSYRDGRSITPGLWAFPVLPLGPLATFEEFERDGLSPALIERWIAAMVDFVVEHRTVRLIYFHPPGAVAYPQVVRRLLERAALHRAVGRFQWYTMSDLARFKTARLKVDWHGQPTPQGDWEFVARHPNTLNEQAWILPKARFGAVRVVEGKAHVEDGGNQWLVIAGEGRGLTFRASVVSATGADQPSGAKATQESPAVQQQTGP